ncbi:low temperature requirement protein A [Hamadaea sp. NPDC051192]|uniref:low temperature requirement protein A n=1 Tax=Hamadaea sp. NPDC051192 TaxID=3154940 RepID=UPI00343C02B2
MSNRGIHDWEPLRRATWLELFCDLVFVVAVARLGQLLHHDHSLGGVVAYVGLFVAVWWLWISFSYFADLFDDDGPGQRVAQLIAALGAAVLAVTIQPGFDSARFAAIFALLLLFLTGLYAIMGRSIPRAAELCRWYVVGSASGAVLWGASLLVSGPARYALWVVALVVNSTVSGPLAYARMKNPPVQVSHMPERFGLFTLVVLGEAVWSTVAGITEGAWSPGAVAVAVSGFVIACGIWWVYFGGFDEAAIDRALANGRNAQVQSFLYGYGHLLIYVAIAATGIGVELAAEMAAHHHHGTLPLFAVAQVVIIAGFILISTGVGLDLGVGRRIHGVLLGLKTLVAATALGFGLFTESPVLTVTASAVAWTALLVAEAIVIHRLGHPKIITGADVPATWGGSDAAMDADGDGGVDGDDVGSDGRLRINEGS